MIEAQEAHDLVERYRAPILAGTRPFRALIAGEGLLLATDGGLFWVAVGARFATSIKRAG